MNRSSKALAAAQPIRLSDEADFSLGELRVKPALREVRWNGGKEQLEPRVMQVLVALAGAQESVVSRDQLIERCWEGRIVGEASINRCISKLRELAVSAGPCSFTIETIPRVGYRLMSANELAATDRGGATAPATAPTATSHSRRISWLFPLGAAALIVAAFALYALGVLPLTPRSPTVSLAAQQPSIAVLPFKNLSSDKDAGYLAAGVQDEILTRLSKIGLLKVISRTSADQFSGGAANIGEIARRLGVANVLEGNVQKSGNTVRINVQLIRAATDSHIWAEDYDRTMDNVFSVQSEVAGAIATVLAAKMTPSERQEITATPTTNAAAYDLYLRALVFAHKNDGASLRTAVQLLEQAVQADPRFALAWAWLARMQAYTHFGDNLAAVRSGAAHTALAKAVALQPNLGDVQAAKGFYLYYGEMNYPAAERELKGVRAKWPNNPEALEALALIERRLGRWNESCDDLTRLISMDPLVPTHRINLATNLEFEHELGRALSVLDDALKIWPDNGWLLSAKAGTYQQMGQIDLAEAVLKNVHPAPDDSNEYFVVAKQYWLQRQYERGAAYFRGLLELEQGPEDTESASLALRVVVAEFLRLKGDKEGARENYSRALESIVGQLKKQPDNVDLLEPLSDVYAGLGDFRKAMRSTDRTIEILQTLNDAFAGADAADSRARLMSRFGDRAAAIDALAIRLKSPGHTTAAILRLDPDFDRLRGDPRFQGLLVARDVDPTEGRR